MSLYAIAMNIIITDIDAIRVHRLARTPDALFRLVPFYEEVASGPFHTRKDYVQQVLPTLEGLGLALSGQPLHVYVSNPNYRTRFPELIAKVKAGYLPMGSFWKVVPKDIEVAHAMQESGLAVFVDSPELCVVTRAAASLCGGAKAKCRIYPLAKAMALAAEFCGFFSMNPFDPARGECLYDIPPIITAEALREYVTRAQNISGLVVAREAARHVVDRFGSIREVALYACLVLRPGLGGLHLEKPDVNAPLKLKDKQLALIKHESITPDLYWLIYKLVLEYDGSDHYTEDGAYEDKRRVFDYQALGLTVIPVTSEDLSNRKALEKLFKIIVRQMVKVDGEKLAHRIRTTLRNEGYCDCRELLLSAILAVE